MPCGPSTGSAKRVVLSKAAPAVCLGTGLLPGDPEVLFLDEPATGLDPVATRDVHELIVGLGRSGVTIFLDSAGGPEMSMIRPSAWR
jgi:ABC-type transporter Mla maintaining outer membrane lipid asymmetry ATPase subunit MlaF